MWRSGVCASAQIVYTLTELDNISRVQLFVNGKRLPVRHASPDHQTSADASHLQKVVGRPTPGTGLTRRTRIPFRGG
jgi:hypothetical protein